MPTMRTTAAQAITPCASSSSETLTVRSPGKWPYAFNKKVKAVKVTVSHYDSKLKLHEATFLVPVEGTGPSKPHANKRAYHS
ncbi:hypothetical protein XGA_0243 [Xanthomonas hortorum ATCC 19865]|nr:hypothetical protein XGA_0243 [Xanthomonas hortorum ATCC 19865]